MSEAFVRTALGGPGPAERARRDPGTGRVYAAGRVGPSTCVDGWVADTDVLRTVAELAERCVDVDAAIVGEVRSVHTAHRRVRDMFDVSKQAAQREYSRPSPADDPLKAQVAIRRRRSIERSLLLSGALVVVTPW
jgi:hypothetical protein